MMPKNFKCIFSGFYWADESQYVYILDLAYYSIIRIHILRILDISWMDFKTNNSY